MKIPEKTWKAYLERLSRIDKTATNKMIAYMNKLPDVLKKPSVLTEYAYGISTKYGEAAAALACEMYDAVAEASGVLLNPAVPAQTATYGEVAKAVNGTTKTGNSEIVANSVGRLVKMAGVDTTMKNAIRDGAEWAWIPNGDSCAFCITLASRGWQKASSKALKGDHATHIHSHCDCTYNIRFDRNTDYSGYDPDKYLDMYEGAEGKTPDDKINALRRKQYEKNKDKINAQKREAYAKQKGIALLNNNGTIEINKATTVEEAKELLINQIGFKDIEASFKKIDDDLAVSTTNQLMNLESKFGIIHKSNGTICAENNKNAVAFVNSRILEPTKQQLSLCPNFYKDKDVLLDIQKKGQASGYKMPCGSSEEELKIYTVTHEYGHILQNYLIQQRYEADGWTASAPHAFVDNSKKTSKARLKWYTERENSVRKECRSEIIKIATEENPDFNLSENLSGYGTTNNAEFFAEVFVNSQLSKPNELGKAMNIWLERKGLI